MLGRAFSSRAGSPWRRGLAQEVGSAQAGLALALLGRGAGGSGRDVGGAPLEEQAVLGADRRPPALKFICVQCPSPCSG